MCYCIVYGTSKQQQYRINRTLFNGALLQVLSIQYKQVGGSTYTSVDITTGRFSFGMADDCDSGAGRGGGPIQFSKKESREVIV